jgi:hypothetical protein
MTYAQNAALPVPSRRGALARALGIYVAGCVGAIQLLDVIVDRMQLDGRLFVFGIVLGVLGVPVVAAATLMLNIAAVERSGAAGRPRLAPSPQPVARTAATVADDTTASLPRQLELALSHLRIAQILEASDGEAEARPHREAFEREGARVRAELTRLLDRSG